MNKSKQIQNGDTQEILQRVRTELGDLDLIEKKMFGGVTLMLNGNMLCCSSRKGLMIRVGKELESKALKLPHASPCDGAGHKMPGFIMIAPEGLDRGLTTGLKMALDYVSTLPAKTATTKANARRPKLVSHRS